MRGQLGSTIILGCIVGAVMYTISQANILLQKQAQENYQQLNFLVEPYLASLSKLTYPTGCGDTEIYELMAYASEMGSADITYCGTSINLNSVIDPYQEEFQAEFGAQRYYLFIEDGNGTAFFISPRTASGIANLTILNQMPLPLPGKNVSRAMIGKVEAES